MKDVDFFPLLDAFSLSDEGADLSFLDNILWESFEADLDNLGNCFSERDCELRAGVGNISSIKGQAVSIRANALTDIYRRNKLPEAHLIGKQHINDAREATDA